MASPRAGRAGQGGFSPRLGARDPRLRSNQAGLVADADLDQKTLARDGAGRTRFAGADALRPIAPDATLSQVIAAYNTLLAKLKGIG